MTEEDSMLVAWAKGVWNRMSLPKHKFIVLWMSIQNRLKTKDKLFRYGVCTDNTCCIRGKGVKSHDHLFFGCVYSQQLLRNILKWIGINPRRRNIHQWITWVYRAYRGTKTRMMILCTVIAATTCQIWRVRNDVY